MRSMFLGAALVLVAVLGITTAASATTRGLITGNEIAPHAINSKHLVNHTIQKHDLSSGLIKSLQGAKGPAATLSNVSRVAGDEYVVQPSTTGFALADCPKGELAISGGFAVIAQIGPAQIIGIVSEPKADLSGWVSGFEDHGTTPATVQAFAVCAPGSAR